MKLDLGACDSKLPGYHTVDLVPPADFVFDLSTAPWPWPDSSIIEVNASHIFEHLPSRIQTMNELWRILMPGARATIEVPNAMKGAGFYQDPTHVSPWCMNTFQYFQNGSANHNRFARHYGIKARFKLIQAQEGVTPASPPWEEVWVLTVIVEAVK